MKTSPPVFNWHDDIAIIIILLYIIAYFFYYISCGVDADEKILIRDRGGYTDDIGGDR